MRFPSHPNFIALIAGLAVVGLAVPAAAGSYYMYETENGGIAFTDDAKRIPARYQDEAEAIGQPQLDDFERFTPMAPSQPAAYAERLGQRLAHLRALNGAGAAPEAFAAPQAAAPGSSVVVRSGRSGNVVETQSDFDASEPTIVKSVRVRPDGQHITELWTVVMRGDEVVSIVRPQARQSNSRWVKESDLR